MKTLAQLGVAAVLLISLSAFGAAPSVHAAIATPLTARRIVRNLNMDLTPAERAAAANPVRGDALAITAAPFQDTWDAMRARDRAQHEPATANRAAPLGIPAMAATKAAAHATADQQLFDEPDPDAPQTTGTLFNARINTGWIPPDTMGAIGPGHFMEVINGNVTIYSRTGTQLSDVTLATFFTVTIGGVTYPRGGAFDPRVLYDRRSGRWFATAMEFGAGSWSNDVILAVCRTSDPTSGTWDKYLLPMHVNSSGGINYFTDHSTIGMDDNGVYFGTRIFPSSGASYAKILATAKAPLIAPAPSLTTVYQWTSISDMYSTPQPAHNHDAVAAGARAWIVAASPYFYSDIQYRRVTWSGGVPSLDASSSTLSTPSFSAPLNAPASNSTTVVNAGDMRLQNTLIRNNRLWTCRSVGVNSSGGATSANRTAAEWLELNVASSTPTLAQSGRVYDPAASDPRFYYYPSIMANGQGHVVLGFSGSKNNEFIGCYTCGRLATATTGTMGAVLLFKAGLASYTVLDTSSRNRWGDYSATTLDPNDDMSMWTIQEYAASPANTWGTYVAKMLSPAPVLVNPATNAPPGTAAFALALTGTGFYDPGTGYTNRLAVVLSGGSPNGITNYSVAYLTPSNVTATFDVGAGASLGSRTIVLTNPDGQSASNAGGFVVVAGTPFVDVTNANATVTHDVTTYTIGGTNNLHVVGRMTWTNSLGGGSNLVASTPWQISAIPLNVGANNITVTGTNAAGTSASNSVTITRAPPAGAPGDVANFVIALATANYSTITLAWSNGTINVLACTNHYYTADLAQWFALASAVTSPWVDQNASNYPVIFYRIVSGTYTSQYDVGKYTVTLKPGTGGDATYNWISPPLELFSNTVGYVLGSQLSYDETYFDILKAQSPIGSDAQIDTYYFAGTWTDFDTESTRFATGRGYMLVVDATHTQPKTVAFVGKVPAMAVTNVLSAPSGADAVYNWIGAPSPALRGFFVNGLTNAVVTTETDANYDLYKHQATIGADAQKDWYYLNGLWDDFESGTALQAPGMGGMLILNAIHTGAGTTWAAPKTH